MAVTFTRQVKAAANSDDDEDLLVARGVGLRAGPAPTRKQIKAAKLKADKKKNWRIRDFDSYWWTPTQIIVYFKALPKGFHTEALGVMGSFTRSLVHQIGGDVAHCETMFRLRALPRRRRPKWRVRRQKAGNQPIPDSVHEVVIYVHNPHRVTAAFVRPDAYSTDEWSSVELVGMPKEQMELCLDAQAAAIGRSFTDHIQHNGLTRYMGCGCMAIRTKSLLPTYDLDIFATTRAVDRLDDPHIADRGLYCSELVTASLYGTRYELYDVAAHMSSPMIVRDKLFERVEEVTKSRSV